MIVGVLGLTVSSLGVAQSWPSRVRKLESELSAPQVDVRRAAARRLGRVGPAEARRLVELALVDEDREVRSIVARRALELGFVPAVDLIRPWLKNADVELRKIALSLLQIDPPEEVLFDVERLLLDPDKTVRALAARTLGRTDPRLMTNRMVPLILALRDVDPLVRGEVAEALGRVGTITTTTQLASLLEDPDAEVRRRALVALSAFDDPSVQSALVAGLLDTDESVKMAAASGLVRMGVSDLPLAIVAELPTLKGRSRKILIEALGRGQSVESREVAKFLVALVMESDDREIAARALVGQGKGVLPYLNECFRKSLGEPVRLCTRVFLAVGGDAALLEELVREGKSTRAELLELFAEAPALQESAIVMALEALSQSDAGVRSRALRVLARPEVKAAAYFGPIRAAVSAEGWSVAERARLLALLEREPSEASLAVARRYVDSTDTRLRRSAARVLVAGNTPATEILGFLLDEETGEVVSEVLSKRAPAALEPLLLDHFPHVGRVRRARLLRATEGLSSSEDARLGQRWTQLLRQARGVERDRVIGLLESRGGPSHLPEDSSPWSELDIAWLAVESRGDPSLFPHSLLTGSRVSERVRALAWQSSARSWPLDPMRAQAAFLQSRSRLERIGILFALARHAARGGRVDDGAWVCRLTNDADPALRLGAFELGRRLGLSCA